MNSAITDLVVALSGSSELMILLKATIVLFLGLGIAGLAVRAQASWRHLIFMTTLVAALALPVIVFTAPGLTIKVPVTISDVPAERSPAARSAASSQPKEARSQPGSSAGFSSLLPSPKTTLLAIWLLGCALLFAAFLRDLWKVRTLRRDGLPSALLKKLTERIAVTSGIKRPIEVLAHEEIDSPVTYGSIRPVIMFPKNAERWPEKDLERAVVHELEHIRRGDWVTQLLARTACIFYWFHPLVWFTWRRLCLEAERACDDAVLQNARSEDYAEQLVALSQRLKNGRIKPVLSMAKRSDLSRRVNALLDAGQRRGRSGLPAIACAAVAGVFAVAAIGPLQATATSDKTPADNTRGESDCSTPIGKALIEAAQQGYTNEIEVLLKAGVDINCQFDGDGTALIVAARNGHFDAVKLLLDRGANVNLGVKGDGNPLIMAAKEGHEKIVSLLLKRGAEVNQIVPGDENALINASGNGHLRIVKLLVEQGAEIDTKIEVQVSKDTGEREIRTALRMARRGGHDDVVTYLVSKGAKE